MDFKEARKSALSVLKEAESRRQQFREVGGINWWARCGILLWVILAIGAMGFIWWLIDFVVANIRGLL